MVLKQRAFFSGGGGLRYKSDRGDLGVKICGLMTTVRAIPVPFRVTRTSLVLNWYLLGVKINSSHAHKTRFRYPLGVIFQNSDDHPRHFNMGVTIPGDQSYKRKPKRAETVKT